MAPIRVGIVGLSTRAGVQSPGSWCGRAHWPVLQSSPAYEVVAITSRSPESAKSVIAGYNLPDKIKIYTSAAEISADPDVDLIVVSLRVEKHLEYAIPAIQAGKDIFVEWPLGASTSEAEEMTQLAASKGVKTIAGLQSRGDCLLQKVKQIIADGTIGKVISSALSANSAPIPFDAWVEGAEYFLEMSSGANEYHVWFAHVLDAFTYILGDFDNLQATLKTQFPSVAIYNAEGKLVGPSYKKTTPDHVVVQGILASGAVGSIVMRKPQSPVDGLGMSWLITGTEGEIEIINTEGLFNSAPSDKKLRMKVGKGEAQDIEFEVPEAALHPEWHHDAYNVSREYDAFVKGDTSRYATFESALKTHRLLDEIVRKADFKY